MKNYQEQVLSYLQTTSQHLFEINGELRKTILVKTKNNQHVLIEAHFDLESNYKSFSAHYHIDSTTSYYKGNAKCVIKHWLFLNKKSKGVRNRKAITEMCNHIKKSAESLDPKDKLIFMKDLERLIAQYSPAVV